MAEALPTSYLAPMYGDYVSDYLGKSWGLSELPYQEYTGDRFAGPSTLQQQAFGGIGGLTLPNYYGGAGNVLQQVANNVPGYVPDQITAGGIGPLLDASHTPTVQSFMSPYMSEVINANQRNAWDQFNRGKAQRDTLAAKAGAFGGDRHGLTEGVAWEGMQNTLADIQNKGMQDAYTAAQAAINNQRDAQIRAGTVNVNAALDAAKANQSAGLNAFTNKYNILTDAGKALANLGGDTLQAQQGIYNQQLLGGATQQAFNQQPLDFGYQQWQESLAYPYNQLQFQQSMLNGLPLSVQPVTPTNPLLEGLMGAGGLYSLLFGGK